VTTSAASAYWGRPRPMRADDPVELAEQVRGALWKFASRTSARGVYRDRQALALVRSRYPAAAGVLPDAALCAVLREPGPGMCSWCAYRALAAAGNEPTPTAPLRALLGKPCQKRCQPIFDAQRVAARERAGMAAAASSPPRQAAVPQTAAHRPPVRFYGSRPLGRPW
jgi:hypothetical protein